MTDESVKLVIVDVDVDSPENARPTQALEETEYIAVRRVPLHSLVSVTSVQLQVDIGKPD